MLGITCNYSTSIHCLP